MGKECTMLEILKLPMEKQDDDEDELELSIGGIYAKKSNSENPNKLGEKNNSSDFSFENGCNSMDLHKRKEIQALRRQEARRKRELKLKKSTNLGFLEGDDKLFLEARKSQARAEDREIREKYDCFSRKKNVFSREFSGGKSEMNDLNLSLCTENNNNGVQGLCLYPPKVQHGYAWMKGNNVGPYQSGNNSSLEYDNSEQQQSNNWNLKMVSNNNNNGSLMEQSSDDHHSKGGSNSDTGSHSSPLGPRQFHNIQSKSPLRQPEANHLSLQPKPNHSLGGVPIPQNLSRVASSSIPPQIPPSSKPEAQAHSHSKESSSGLVDKPPKPPNNNHLNASSIPRMPCVTATGNGPNGKTISGILYQYTKEVVSIMCVCHGSSFSPAGFVEHAGGVDVSNPLRHITIVPPR